MISKAIDLIEEGRYLALKYHKLTDNCEDGPRFLELYMLLGCTLIEIKSDIKQQKINSELALEKLTKLSEELGLEF